MVSDAITPRVTCTIDDAVARMIEHAELDGTPIDEPADIVAGQRIALGASRRRSAAEDSPSGASLP
jgi:hypothetical protein